MAATKTVWGIDLGQCALKAICLRAVEDKVEAVGYAYIEHPQLLSKPEIDRQKMIEEAMDKFLKDHELDNETIVVGVPGQHTLARFTKLPPVDKKKIPEIVKYEAQQQIPFDMDEVIWDYQVFQDPDAVETEVGIFAMRRELLRDHLQFLTSRNLEPAIVQSSPLALFNALKFDGLCGTEGVVILDIGTQNTDLIVADVNSLWTRNIPIGGNNFTEALLKTFKLSFSKAENLKRGAASHKYARQIFQAMRPTFADLVAEIQRSIGFFTSSRRGVKLSKLIAMGNAFKLPGMQKYIQQNLGMEVVRPTTFSKLSASGAPNAPQLIDQLLSFGVAYGLALQGLGSAAITSNLLPTEIAKQVVWKKKAPWFYGAAACLIMSAGLVWAGNTADKGALKKARGGTPPRFTDNSTVSDLNKIIEDGPGEGLSPKNYAQTILEASKGLQTRFDNEKIRNEPKIQQLEEIEKLHTHKAVWPKILQMIHSALPPIDKTLQQAIDEGPEAYKKLVQSDKKYERQNRNIIFIEQMQAKYFRDVHAAYLNEISGAGPAGHATRGMSSMGVEETQQTAGFVITITGHTPNKEGCQFINDTFKSNLEEASMEGIYFESPDLNQCVKVRSPDANAGRFNVPGRNIRPPARRVARAPHTGFTVLQEDAYKDPVTAEPTDNDHTFVIVFKAILGEKPKTEEQPDTENTDDNN